MTISEFNKSMETGEVEIFNRNGSQSEQEGLTMPSFVSGETGLKIAAFLSDPNFIRGIIYTTIPIVLSVIILTLAYRRDLLSSRSSTSPIFKYPVILLGLLATGAPFLIKYGDGMILKMFNIKDDLEERKSDSVVLRENEEQRRREQETVLERRVSIDKNEQEMREERKRKNTDDIDSVMDQNGDAAEELMEAGDEIKDSNKRPKHELVNQQPDSVADPAILDDKSASSILNPSQPDGSSPPIPPKQISSNGKIPNQQPGSAADPVILEDKPTGSVLNSKQPDGSSSVPLKQVELQNQQPGPAVPN